MVVEGIDMNRHIIRNVALAAESRFFWQGEWDDKGLVLGCIEAKFCNKVCVGKLSPKSTKCTPLHRSRGIRLGSLGSRGIRLGEKIYENKHWENEKWQKLKCCSSEPQRFDAPAWAAKKDEIPDPAPTSMTTSSRIDWNFALRDREALGRWNIGSKSSFSCRIRNTSEMSFGKIVIRMAWTAHILASINNRIK